MHLAASFDVFACGSDVRCDHLYLVGVYVYDSIDECVIGADHRAPTNLRRPMLESVMYSAIPTLCVISVGYATTLWFTAFLRFRAGKIFCLCNQLINSNTSKVALVHLFLLSSQTPGKPPH